MTRAAAVDAHLDEVPLTQVAAPRFPFHDGLGITYLPPLKGMIDGGLRAALAEGEKCIGTGSELVRQRSYSRIQAPTHGIVRGPCCTSAEARKKETSPGTETGSATAPVDETSITLPG
jgi:hypothetical protein